MRKYLLCAAVLLLVIPAAAQEPFRVYEPEADLFKPLTSADWETAIPVSLAKTKRVIVDSPDKANIRLLEERGCLIRHALESSASLECPANVKGPFRESRVFMIADDRSNVQIGADRAWAMNITGKGAKVVILDTGADYNHTELNDSYLGGYDFVENDTDPQDENGHGTHVAGIITADGVHTIDGMTARGVAPDAGFYMLKVCNSDGFCEEDDIMAAMEYAVNRLDAKVMSISLGGENFADSCDSDPLAAKVKWVADNGILVVIAAGNSGKDVISTPACASKAVAVGAVDANDIMTSWSNYGKELDIVAPGVSILSAYSCLAAGDCGYYWYTKLSGTSMATPHVSGVAALLLEKNPDYTAQQLKDSLFSTAKKLGGRFSGHGRVDAFSAVGGNSTDNGLEIYNITIALSGRAATIKWQTNAESRDTLFWGPDRRLRKKAYTGYSTEKEARLSSLVPGRTYYFKIQARDRNGNVEMEDNGGLLYNFAIHKPSRKSAPPLSISNIIVKLDGNTAAVSWLSDGLTGILSWGPDTQMRQKNYVFGPSKQRSTLLTSLHAGTTYYFKIQETDWKGNAVIDDNNGMLYNFTA